MPHEPVAELQAARGIEHTPPRRGSDDPDFALRADSDLAQLAFIRAGFGIGMCQVPLAARDPSLVRVLPDVFSLDLGLWVVMHEDLKTSPRCRAVFDALAQGLSF